MCVALYRRKTKAALAASLRTCLRRGVRCACAKGMLQVRRETYVYDFGSPSGTALSITELVSGARARLRAVLTPARSYIPQIPESRDDSKAFKERASVRVAARLALCHLFITLTRFCCSMMSPAGRCGALQSF